MGRSRHGNQDGSNSVSDPNDGRKEGVYLHYWDGSAPAFNEGADGLQRLDYVIAKASQLDIRLIIPFVNNWKDFGGMDQYVRWRGGQFHDDFYTDPIIRTWCKEWGRAAPESGEQHHGGRLQERSHHQELGAGERAALQERRPPTRRLRTMTRWSPRPARR